MQAVPFRTRTETVDGVEYVLTEMDGGTSLAIQLQMTEEAASTSRSVYWRERIIAESLKVTVDDLRKLSASQYTRITEVLGPIALELNGFKTGSEAPGESQAGASPAV